MNRSGARFACIAMLGLMCTHVAHAQPLIPEPPSTRMEVLVATARSATVNGEYELAARAYLEALTIGGGLDLACEAAEVLVVLGRATEGHALAEVVLAESSDITLVARARQIIEGTLPEVTDPIESGIDEARSPHQAREPMARQSLPAQSAHPQVAASSSSSASSVSAPRRRRGCGRGRCFGRILRFVAEALFR